MAKKIKVHRGALEHYCRAHDIEFDPDDLDSALDAIKEMLEEKLSDKESEEDKFTCETCSNYILDEDVFCWYCGGDVSEDDSGSFDDRFAKKVTVIDKTEKKEAKKPEKETKKETKKSKPKKEVKKAKPKKEAKKVEVEEEEPEEEIGDQVSLDQRTAKILQLGQATGEAAWDMGAELRIVFDTHQWKEGKFKNVSHYCEKALAMTKASAYNYARIATSFTREEASQLEVGKLILLARVKNEKDRAKLLKAALPKQGGGKGLDRDALAEQVKETRDKNNEKSRSPGRPKIGWANLTGSSFKASYSDDDHTEALIHDEDVMGANAALHVKLLKKSIQVDIVPLEE